MNIEGISLDQTVVATSHRSVPPGFNLGHPPPDGGSKAHESSIGPTVIPWATPLVTPLAAWSRVFPGL
jgi:hypothetical protein